MGATPCDIILVLDQSSSMTSNKIGKETRLAVLKRVAKDFVATVYDSSVENEVNHRIALVSFSGTKDNYKGKHKPIRPLFGISEFGCVFIFLSYVKMVIFYVYFVGLD